MPLLLDILDECNYANQTRIRDEPIRVINLNTDKIYACK